jgi:Tfp pilus assembly protein PilF
MQITRQKILIYFFTILIIFGVFYAWREKISGDYLKSADTSYVQNKTDKALSNLLFADVLSEGNKNSQAKIQRAEIFYEENDAASAEKELLEALKTDDKNPKIYEFLGKVKKRQENFSDAEKYYQKAYALDPSSEILTGRIKNLIRGGKSFQAKEILGNIKQKKFDDDIHYYLGLIDFNERGIFPEEFSKISSGKYEKEVRMIEDFCQKSDKTDEGLSDYQLVRKADLFNKINETDFAFLNINAVLQRNDKYCDAYIVLGKSLLIDGEYQKSADAFRKCLEIDTNNSESSFWLSGVYEKSGDSQKATEYKEKCENLTK